MSSIPKNDFARAINALTYKEMLDVARDLGVMFNANPNSVAEYLGEVADKILYPDTTPDTDIPGAVYYSPTHGNFYSAMSKEGMGTLFLRRWFRRRAEFPQEDPKS